MNGQLLLLLVCIYGGLLFGIAWLAERYGHKLQFSWWRPLIYALSLGVYCSSWTFLGTVGTAADSGWSFLPIYLGPIFILWFGWRFIRRLLVISARNKVTSVADFIGSRYGKNQPLAAAVTLVMVLGTLPYIALQLRAVVLAWSTINWDINHEQLGDYTSLITALVMVWFAILFGTRLFNEPERLRGMLTAVATESIVKLVAFVSVAVFAWSLLAGGSFWSWPDFKALGQYQTQPNFSWDQIFTPSFLTQVIVSAFAFVCLPRQFHLMVVEYHQRSDLRFVRWLTPLYLAAFAVFALPITFAATYLLSGLDIPSDSYVLLLPQWLRAETLVAVTFLGALSAATGMVVVATVALSIMIANELIVPAWLSFSSRRVLKPTHFGRALRFIRRFSILVVLLLAWALEQSFSTESDLASLGFLSFTAAAQVMPALIAGMYWYRGHSKGVLAGLALGMLFWLYCLLVPTLLTHHHTLIVDGPWGITWLSPHNLLGGGFLDPLSHGLIWSLIPNCLAFWLVSRRSHLSALDIRQADAFTQVRWPGSRSQGDREPSDIEVQQLQALVQPLFGAERTQNIWQQLEHQLGHRLLPHDKAPFFVVQTIEAELAAIIGAMSAHRAMQLLARQQPLHLQDFVSLVSGSSRQIQFSQTLLQTTLENIPQGISVVDEDLRLVAWNQPYQNLFNYPQRLLYVGCRIETIYQFNAERGYLGASNDDKGSMDAAIERRLNNLKSGQPYLFNRILPNGLVLEIRGTPLANGGYVTTYTDITDHHRILAQLEEAKHHLEDRVAQRTAELTELNETLQKENRLRAKMEGELKAVHASKSRFLAAASHDLLQPVNAARLFVSSLLEKVKKPDLQADDMRHDLKYLDAALGSTEQLISTLREISRLSSGREQARRENFDIHQILGPLASEAQVLADEAGLEFCWVPTHQWVYTDPHLLRRVAQNFISNALRYTKKGKVLLGCRRKQQHLVIEVWDTGPGIDARDREKIFEEFERLPGHVNGNQGLGLGLSIVKSISDLLGHGIHLDSWPGSGSVFRITVPLGTKQAVATRRVVDTQLSGVHVLCIDNEEPNREGMRSLLEQWGCVVETAADLGQCLSRWAHTEPPEIILADYHLDNETGLDVLQALTYHWGCELSAMIISADNSEGLRGVIAEAGYGFLAKPVQPAALRTTIRQLLRRKQMADAE